MLPFTLFHPMPVRTPNFRAASSLERAPPSIAHTTPPGLNVSGFRWSTAWNPSQRFLLARIEVLIHPAGFGSPVKLLRPLKDPFSALIEKPSLNLRAKNAAPGPD